MKPIVCVLLLCVFAGCQPPEASVDYGAICAVETAYVSMLSTETPKKQVAEDYPPVVVPQTQKFEELQPAPQYVYVPPPVVPQNIPVYPVVVPQKQQPTVKYYYRSAPSNRIIRYTQ